MLVSIVPLSAPGLYDWREIDGLSVMRNLAAHSSGREITPEKATDFLVLVDAVLHTLRQPPRPR